MGSKREAGETPAESRLIVPESLEAALPYQPSNQGDSPMSQQINHHRRRFLGAAAMTIAAAELGMVRSANARSSQAQPADVPTIKPNTV
jgi:hypothetical protein